ncbi:subtilisin family serine protease [Hamadaea flava]|uniref:S8 family serine peptidase n=1 Tax=Hamadaea flava TaxID=1742688 RepID=A0ABV8LYK7_9ACTN|nr:S8 family serine peptidase [Hamadaea flava]MCP2322183.1 subtilisin family serine protease [Hamadaea flava]
MRQRTRTAAALLTALTLAVGPVPAATAAATATAAAQPIPSTGDTITVTLITGDTVTIATGPGGIAAAEPHTGPGRDDITFTTRSDGPGDITVIPSDALTLVAAGRLDERLFDVDRLVAYGYTGESDLPLIVEQTSSAGVATLARELPAAKVTKHLPKLRMNTMRAAKAQRKDLWRQLVNGDRLQPGLDRVWLDGQTRISLDQSVPQIGAPDAWKAGYTGAGVTVAMLDSGYDSDHPMLAGRVALAQDFTGVGSAEDDHGHGTHVLSTIGGATDGNLRGVAPEARLVVGKICTAGGSCPDSATLAGMEWAVTTAGAKIVSMSIGGPDEAGDDPLEYAINELSAQTGALFVVAAGNSGENGLNTVESPGTADAALSVGAVGRDDSLAYFSSRGARLGDNAVKPEITAPGVGIVAAKLGGGSVAMSGTSMATPHVSGAAALLAQQHPQWNGQQLKSALMGAAKPKDGLTAYHQGTGRVDLTRAVSQQVTVTPANLSAVAGWSREPGAEKSHQLTYRNDGDVATSLKLTVGTPSSPGGQVGNTALFTLDRDTIDVPAHGTASVAVTVHDVMPRGTQAAILTAASADGTVSVRSILADDTPVPSWKVSATVLDRNGAPARGTVELVDRYNARNYYLNLVNGVAMTTVPEGEYYAAQNINTTTPRSGSLVIVPVTVSADTAITLDARAANPVDVQLHDPQAEGVALVASVTVPFGDGTRAYSSVAGRAADFGTVYVAPMTDPRAGYRAYATFAQRGATSANPSPYFYEIIDERAGGVPADLTYETGRERLAKVTVDYRGQGAESTGDSGTTPAGSAHPTITFDQPVMFPSRVEHYRTPGAWNDRIRVAGRMSLQIPPRVYGPGQDNRLVWNSGVVGPNMTLDAFARQGDNMGLHSSNVVQWFIGGNDGEYGTDWGAEGTLDLSRDGQLIKRWNAVGMAQSGTRVPTDPGVYSLHGSVTRSRPYAGLSTKLDVEWTFPSASSADLVVIPLIGVHADVKGLDLNNAAQANSTSQITLTLQRSQSAAPSPTTLTSLEVSFDDGVTWQPVDVDGGTAKIKNPAGDGYASLRATAHDEAGNTVRQTIIRAYGVRA